MKILVFAPHAQIWKHAFPEALFVEALQQKGHEVSYMGCGSALVSNCIPLISNYVPYDSPASKKNKICKLCKKNASVIKNRFGFRGFDLDAFLDKEMVSAINFQLANVTQKNFKSCVINEIKVGRIALYELVLRHKLMEVDELSDEIWNEYLSTLESVLKTFYVMEKVIATEKPDRVIAYNGLYSVNTACREVANKSNIPFYWLHAGLNQKNRLENLMVGKDHTFAYYRSIIGKWKQELFDIPCSKKDLAIVTDNFIDIINGGSWMSYSESSSKGAFKLREEFNIPLSSSIVTVVLSSLDEKIAAESVGAYIEGEGSLFISQVEWLKELLKFMGERDDLFMIIRPHPRELGAAREVTKVISKHSKELRKILVNTPHNVRVNWPSDNLSIYDLMEETNLFLNAYSTSAREMTMLGLPVLTYKNEDVLEPVSITYTGSSKAEYLEQIDVNLKQPFDPERIRRGFRWRATELIYSHINISESVFMSDDYLSITGKAKKALSRSGDYIFKGWSQYRDCNKRSERLLEIEKINRLVVSGFDSALDLINTSEMRLVSPDDDLPLIREEIKRLMEHIYSPSTIIRKGTLRSYLTEFVNND